MVAVGVKLVVQPCFVAAIRGLARPTLGKEEGSLGKEDIANQL